MKTSKSWRVYCLVVLSTLCAGNTFAQSISKLDLDEAKKEIAISDEIYFQSFAKNDASIFTNRYADDCWIMPPNAPAVCGSDAAKDFFEKSYNQFGVRNGKFITVDIYGISEDIVAEIGFWKVFNANQVESDDGKFLVLWKKTPKGWKMWRDSFNSSRPKN